MSGGIVFNPDAGTDLTTLGDMHAFSTVNGRFPVGTNGQILESRSTETFGLQWIAAAGGSAQSFLIATRSHSLESTPIEFMGVSGGGANSTENITSVPIPVGFTWSNLSMNITVDSSAGSNGTIRSRDDSSTVNQVITITGTGVFEDTSNTDTVVGNSLCNYIWGAETSSGTVTGVGPASVATI